uniref:Uncharacterized protein n=1 Tax=Anopheles quadriannulatus TaxID=34691 RepID=A0A182XRB2_ANOQN
MQKSKDVVFFMRQCNVKMMMMEC